MNNLQCTLNPQQAGGEWYPLPPLPSVFTMFFTLRALFQPQMDIHVACDKLPKMSLWYSWEYDVIQHDCIFF